ncbi:YciI family protein [Allonocardiopsis opalescens]|uniref:YCII-related domain-containing protein n=1 Tax=Allonocardiopsis opalescens TaxID=1144618 RepID=A0A2T0PSF7_9ACTN|nr:YciI family protein [Allonocardiopsis opalescens]PRX91827.1 hypothetical protein CLV72_11312 [Allonocardiopsis opalescens]
MKYMILIYGNDTTQEQWLRRGAAERAEGLRAYTDLDRELAASGELIVSESLAPDTTRVGVRGGRARTLPALPATDGPFAEAKEYLAGFYLVEVADLDRAVQIAGRIPEAAFDMVAVRPVQDLSAFL